MKIFKGYYSWNGRKEDGREPISWYPGGYDLRISRLDSGEDKVQYLKPVICIFTNTGTGHSVSANPEKFSKRICEDFSLELEKVLWVEQITPGEEVYEVIIFTEKLQLAGQKFYLISRRKPTVGEQLLIDREMEKK